MNTRSIIVGIIAVVIIAAIGWTVAKRLPKISLLETIKSRFTKTENITPAPTGTFGGGTIADANSGAEENLKSCTAEILSQNCSAVEKTPVCGYESVIGRESARSLDYVSACHYCKLYGSDGVLDMGDYQIQGLGYTEGPCQ